VTQDARIGEADFGRGAQSKSGFFGVPALMELAQDAGIDPMTYDLHGGESIGRLAQRVALFLSELVEQHAGETVVIVCHGGVIRVALFTLLKLPTSSIATLKHVNTAYTILDLVEDGSWRAQVIAASDHLDEVS
jgi:broad specificity phosphatase PhoE